jgi:hypothetical protein
MEPVLPVKDVEFDLSVEETGKRYLVISRDIFSSIHLSRDPIPYYLNINKYVI